MSSAGPVADQVSGSACAAAAIDVKRGLPCRRTTASARSPILASQLQLGDVPGDARAAQHLADDRRFGAAVHDGQPVGRPRQQASPARKARHCRPCSRSSPSAPSLAASGGVTAAHRRHSRRRAASRPGCAALAAIECRRIGRRGDGGRRGHKSRRDATSQRYELPAIQSDMHRRPPEIWLI